MKTKLLFTLVLVTSTLSAQITVTNANFPVPGDTLFYATDNDPAGIEIGPNSGPNVWDFSSLTADVTDEVIFLDAATSPALSDFPDATIYSEGQTRDRYYRTTSSVFEDLGYIGADQLNLGLDIASPYLPPVPLRRSPMNFIDINNMETNQIWAAPIGDFADSILPQIGLIDSIRFRINTTRVDVVDAFGTCILPEGVFEVLREKRLTISETEIEVYVLFGWLSLTDFIGGGSGGLFDAIGTDSTLAYHFISNVGKEDIAVLDLDPTDLSVQSVRYRNRPLLTASPYISAQTEVSFQPNPVQDYCKFQYQGLMPGQYDLDLYHATGVKVQSTHFMSTGNGNIEQNLSAFPAGQYYFVLNNDKGENIATKGIILID